MQPFGTLTSLCLVLWGDNTETVTNLQNCAVDAHIKTQASGTCFIVCDLAKPNSVILCLLGDFILLTIFLFCVMICTCDICTGDLLRAGDCVVQAA